MRGLRGIHRWLLPSSVRKSLANFYGRYFVNYGTISYSQEGEDCILRRMFEGRANGFFVDVGAHHPARFSNTFLLYKLGWRGINVDAFPGVMEMFSRVRPEDINIEAAISDSIEPLDYYIFNEPAINGVSSELSESRVVPGGPYRILGVKQVLPLSLEKLLDDYLPKGKEIDFLNVDTEGHDLSVLRSNDWNKYSPRVVLVEVLDGGAVAEVEKSETVRFLVERGYSLYAKTVNTVILRRTF